MKLTEEKLRKIVRNCITEILGSVWDKDDHEDTDVYILFNGSEYDTALGCDLSWELEKEGVEVAEGPFSPTDMSKIHKRVRELNSALLCEYRDTDQWDYEKKLFFDGLFNGTALFDKGFVGVFYPGTENSNDPRMIYYREGDNRLTDDHFYIQHSPTLSDKELKDIKFYAAQFGADIELPPEIEF